MDWDDIHEGIREVAGKKREFGAEILSDKTHQRKAADSGINK